MSPKARQTQTLMEVALRNAGLRRGFRACQYIAQWAIASEAEGQSLNADGVAAWWKENRATTFRNQAAFREAFPGELTPERLWSLVGLADVTEDDRVEVVARISSTKWAA